MRLRLAFSAVLVVACGDDEGAAPGTELGPCVQERFCNSPLVCADGLCVHPDQLDGSAGGETGSASAEGDGTGASTTVDDGGEAEGGGAEVYCTQGDPDACICGHTADYGPLDAPCSTETVTSPAQCCASEGWPAYGGCSCWALSCRILSPDTCYCGLGTPDGMDEPTASCTAGEGVCCLDAEGGTCSCYTSITSCLEGDEVVSSCSVESLSCGSSTEVSACN